MWPCLKLSFVEADVVCPNRLTPFEVFDIKIWSTRNSSVRVMVSIIDELLYSRVLARGNLKQEGIWGKWPSL